MTQRKGARSMAAVTPEVRAGLNGGTLETASLPEMLVLDCRALLSVVLADTPARLRKKLVERLDPGAGVVRRMEQAGSILHDHLGPEGYDELRRHPSDTVRGWAAYVLAASNELTLEEQLTRLRPLADDPHFGVREWAWMAIRPNLAADLPAALRLLQPWTGESRVNLRRFAVESVRPVGVWCRQIAELRRNPERGLPLLEALRAESEKYPQDSVANWLNDAARSKPDWVRAVCARWLGESDHPATRRIVQRALRRIGAAAVTEGRSPHPRPS